MDVDEPSRTAACLEMFPLDESPAEGNGERGGAEDEAEGLGRKLNTQLAIRHRISNEYKALTSVSHPLHFPTSLSSGHTDCSTRPPPPTRRPSPSSLQSHSVADQGSS